MIEAQPVRYHITRREDQARLCDGRTAGEKDIPIGNIEALREARAEATLCPVCQVKSGHQPFRLRLLRRVYGQPSLAYLYTTPVQDRFDKVGNCPHCRQNPGQRTCRAWRELARSVRVLRREASLMDGEVTELLDVTAG